MPSRWKNDRPMSRTAFAKRFPDDAACARHLFEKRWPNGFVCPKCQGAKAWALELQALHLRMRRLRPPNVGHRRHRLPSQPSRPADLVPGYLRCRQPLQRHLRTATPSSTRPRLLQDRLANAAKAAARHGRSGSIASRRPRRGRRERYPLSHQGRPDRRRPRPQRRRQATFHRRDRTLARRPSAPHPTRAA